MYKYRRISKIVWMTLVMIIVIGGSVFAEGEDDSVISAGSTSTYVVKNDGSLWAWGGMNAVGNGTGHKDRTITPVKILSDVRTVSANDRGGIAVKKDDTLWGGWGDLLMAILMKTTTRHTQYL